MQILSLPPRVSHQSQQAVGKRRSQDSQALSRRSLMWGKDVGESSEVVTKPEALCCCRRSGVIRALSTELCCHYTAAVGPPRPLVHVT